MKLFWLLALSMTAFAFNSVLNRLALAGGDMGPASYVAIRLLSGAVVLAVLIRMRTRKPPHITPLAVWSAAALALYALGFSYAYITLPTGPGALILFGGVQVMSFTVTLARGQRIDALNWLGAALAFGGLCYLLWPDTAAPMDYTGAALMLAAALGWTFFTVAGAHSTDPLGATWLAFVIAAPVGVLAWLVMPDNLSLRGALFAVLSGALTSAMGYALWYRVLGYISMPMAAVAQLSVPVIAALAGALLLGEALTLRFALATCVVLCGVGLAIFAQTRRA